HIGLSQQVGGLPLRDAAMTRDKMNGSSSTTAKTVCQLIVSVKGSPDQLSRGCVRVGRRNCVHHKQNVRPDDTDIQKLVLTRRPGTLQERLPSHLLHRRLPTGEI